MMARNSGHTEVEQVLTKHLASLLISDSARDENSKRSYIVPRVSEAVSHYFAQMPNGTDGPDLPTDEFDITVQGRPFSKSRCSGTYDKRAPLWLEETQEEPRVTTLKGA